MGTAILSLAHLLEWLLAEHPQPTFFFFFGLILGTIPFILYKVNYKTNFKKHHYVILLIAAVIVLLSGLFQGDEEAAVIATGSAGSFATLFFSGWLASTAMILPGISGSFVLVIIGVYQTVINALTEFNLPVLFTFGVGVLVGIAIMSKLLRYLLRAHTVGTYAVITGLLLGSLYVIFPGLNDGVIAFILSLVMFAAGLVLALFLGRIDRTRAV
jgi:putative membrane protein